jgi:transcriptional regulator with XRE-family HTH domain
MSRSYTGYKEEFRRVVEELTRYKTLREIAAATGISHTTADDLRSYGKVPHYTVLKKFADGLDANPHQRAQLFIEAGYREEERPQVERLITGLRSAGYDVQDADYLTPSVVEAILAAVVGNRMR